jgi:hypothetical protein
LFDENAFGVLLAHYDLESIEYSLGDDAFLEYVKRFSDLVATRAAEQPIGTELRRIDFGHAIYFEFADGDQLSDPIAWTRGMRHALVMADLPNVCVLAAGGRWKAAPDEDAAPENDLLQTDTAGPLHESGAWRVGPTPLSGDSNTQASPNPLVNQIGAERSPTAYGPSEPLRKVLAAEALAQPATSGNGDPSFGPGLYVDKEAIEQLGKSLKNTPTALPVLSTIFYRIGG